jgi:uncharacterized protein (DUF934 family)
MRRLLRQREIVIDEWRYFGEEAPEGVAPEAQAVIVPLTELRANPQTWEAWPGRLGVRLAPADRVEDIAGELARFAIIAVDFPGSGEGRGYSHARILRGRLGYKGELRAVNVKRDQLFLLARAGFDSFDLAPGENPETVVEYLQRYTVAYQPGAPFPPIQRQRYFA